MIQYTIFLQIASLTTMLALELLFLRFDLP